MTKELKKISAFELAIMQAVEPERANNYVAYTDKKINDAREKKIRDFYSRIKTQP